jgi:F-type H+-transporting ATPase subunit delta
VVAQRYAKALIETAREADCLDRVEGDLKTLQAMLDHSGDLQRIVYNPLFAAGDRRNALDALGQKAGFHARTINFLKVLVDNRRLRNVEAIISAVAETRSAERGELTAEVRSACALDDEARQKLVDQLAKVFGRSVNLDTAIDESLLGGLIVTVNSVMVDDSLASKLARLKSVMQNRANENLGGEKQLGGTA